jgi:hypothetical protein
MLGSNNFLEPISSYLLRTKFLRMRNRIKTEPRNRMPSLRSGLLSSANGRTCWSPMPCHAPPTDATRNKEVQEYVQGGVKQSKKAKSNRFLIKYCIYSQIYPCVCMISVGCNPIGYARSLPRITTTSNQERRPAIKRR